MFQAKFFHSLIALIVVTFNCTCKKRPVSEKKVKFVITAKNHREERSQKSTYQLENENPSAKVKH